MNSLLPGSAAVRRSAIRQSFVFAWLLLLPGLAAAQPGTISGTVLGGGSTPLQNAEVRVYDSNEIQAAAPVFTDASGAYSVGNLAPGTYYAQVHTGNVTGGSAWVDQLYPSIPCIGYPATTGTYCRINTGGVITVTAATTTPNINFNVGLGGSISGIVTAGGTPYSGTPVTLYAAIGGGAETRLMANTTTNAAGGYTLTRLPPGSYYLWAANVIGGPAGGFVGEGFDNVTCPHAPFPTSGTAPCRTATLTPLIVTSGGALTANVDLAPGGGISGAVTNLGTPVNNARVRVYSTAGHLVREAQMLSGSYNAAGLPAGDYRLATVTTAGVEDEVYDNIACGADCTAEIPTGTLVGVKPGAVTSGVNFDLGLHAPEIQEHPRDLSRITGQVANLGVTAAGALPLSYQWYVGPSGNTSSPIGGATSSSYTTPALTVTTDYWVRVTNALGTADSETATVTVGAASITGTVASGATPLQNAQVTIYRGNETVATSASTNASGAYQIVPLPPGTYYAFVFTGNVTTGGGGYVDQLYPSTPCIGSPAQTGTYCRINMSTPILVTAGGTIAGINFNVGVGGSIGGTVTAAGTPYANTQVQLHANLGGAETRAMLSTTTSAAGAYAMNRLPPGTYYVWAGNVTGGAATGYVGEMFNDVTCPHAPIPTSGTALCRTGTVTPLVVTAGGSLPATNFDLALGGQITGTVTRLGVPISGRVRIYTTDGHLARDVTSSSDGTYSAAGLPAGDYRLATALGFITQDEVYNNISCGADCAAVLSSGALVGVKPGAATPGVNFDLALKPNPPTILSHPADRSILPGQSTTLSVIVANVPPLTYQWYVGPSGNTGSPIGGATSSSYTTPPLASTTDYWVRVTNADGTADSDTATVTILTPSITGTVSGGGTPLQNAEVRVYRADETLAATVFTSASGAYQVAPLAAGTYYAYVFTGNVTGGGGYVDQLYPSTPCLGAAQSTGTYCRINTGGPIVVNAGSTTSGINFNVGLGGTISGTVLAGGVAYLGTNVQLHANLGGPETRGMLTTGTNGAGGYTMTRVPPGTYYVWSGNVTGAAPTGFIAEVFDNVTCPHAPFPTSGSAPCRVATVTPLVVTAGGALTANFDLAPGGRIDGMVTSLATPVENVRVRIYSTAGHLTREVVTGAGNYTAPGLPAGQYRLATLNIAGLEDEVYDNIPCGEDCTSELSGGALVTVTVGAATGGVNFDLAPSPPTIQVEPAGQTIASGLTAALQVVATGAPPLSYQWYAGSSGNTAAPIGGATSSSYTTPALTAAANYWVRVTNAYGTDDSATATILIGQPAQITTHPASQTIASGSTATLTVAATGTAPLAYQWYSGLSGNTASPIAGATASSFTTPALTAAANYWVRVSNAFGAANSTTAAIAIGVAPSIATPPADQTIPEGTATTLQVAATGTAPLAYQWYEGDSGVTTLPMAGATGSTWTTPTLTESKRYWVRVSNAYGSVNSAAAGVTVLPPVGVPFGLYVRAIEGSLWTFAWQAGAGQQPATSYVIEGGMPGSETVLAQIDTGGPATSHSVDVPNGVFWVQVRAVAGPITGAPSARINICRNFACPALSPGNLLGMANGSDLLLAWATPLENDWPAVIRLLVTGAYTTFFDLAGTQQTFTYSGVPAGSYQFRVAACNSGVCSAPSNEVALGFPAACSGPPQVPTNFVAGLSGTVVTLTWDLPAAGPAPENYLVTVTGAYVGSFTVGARTLSGSVGPGSYTVQVAAANACGTGPATAAITVTIP